MCNVSSVGLVEQNITRWRQSLAFSVLGFSNRRQTLQYRFLVRLFACSWLVASIIDTEVFVSSFARGNKIVSRCKSNVRAIVQAGRSQVRTPTTLDCFFNLLNPSSRTVALVFTQSLTEISTTGSVSRLSRKCLFINVSEPYWPPRPITGIALLYGDGVCFLWGTNWTLSTATSSQYLAVNCEPIVYTMWDP
jgi:hypothetical protein